MFEHKCGASARTKKHDIETWDNLSIWKEFQTHFPDLSALDSNFIYSAWRCSSRWINNSITCDAFEALPLAKFLSKMSELYSVTEVPVKALLMFPFIYLCKQGFSVMFCMKTKFVARLHERRPPHLLIQLFSPNLGPDFDQTSSALTLKLLLEYRFLFLPPQFCLPH